MAMFLIKYTDPVTQNAEEVIETFKDTVDPVITAQEWAEDYAYSLADKGSYTVKKIKE